MQEEVPSVPFKKEPDSEEGILVEVSSTTRAAEECDDLL
jgi:hypothetical protein